MNQTDVHWIQPADKVIPPDLYDYLAGDLILAGALLRRGISSAAQAKTFLNPDYYSPADPSDLPDLDKTVYRIQQAIDQRQCIGI